jgi:hypothetical protein
VEEQISAAISKAWGFLFPGPFTSICVGEVDRWPAGQDQGIVGSGGVDREAPRKIGRRDLLQQFVDDEWP